MQLVIAMHQVRAIFNESYAVDESHASSASDIASETHASSGNDTSSDSYAARRIHPLVATLVDNSME